METNDCDGKIKKYKIFPLYNRNSSNTPMAEQKQPVLPTFPALESLKILNDISVNSGAWDPQLRQIAQTELKYIKAASAAINASPVLNLQYGGGLSAVFNVAALLKQQQELKFTTDLLNKYVTDIPSLLSNIEENQDVLTG